jgi:GNAT superfamily N-acetyltransferase
MTTAVRRAVTADLPTIAAALTDAFDDDPVMAWLFPKPSDRRKRLDRWFRIEGARHLLHDTVWCDEAGRGAAYWDPPGHWRMTPGQILRSLPRTAPLFGRRIPTALRGLARVEGVHPDEPHHYLAVLGTAAAAQGKGVGSALLAPTLEECDATGVPAYLESSKERNIPFYARHGFEVTGEVQLPKGPMIWTMWRAPR